MPQEPKIISLMDAWDGESDLFDLPPHGHPIQEAVMPLLAVVGDRLYPVGTCFLVTRFGLVMSAAHNMLHVASRYHYRGDWVRRTAGREPGPKTLRLSDVGLYALWQRNREDGQIEGMPWPFTYSTQNEPNDIIFGLLRQAEDLASGQPFTFCGLRLSPGMPKAGSKIRVIGYRNMLKEGAIHEGPLEEGAAFTLTHEHTLSVAIGKVDVLYSERRERGLFNFPCFRTSAPMPPGFSGGPVVNEEGLVCGVACGESIHGEGSYVSLIYPALVAHLAISFPDREGGCTPLDLIRSGHIETDGTESMAIYTKTGAEPWQWRVEYPHEAHNNGHCFRDADEEDAGEEE